MDRRLASLFEGNVWRKLATRAVVLLILLAVVKGLLVVYFGHNLYESHMRPRPDARCAGDVVNFAVCGLVLAGSFFAVGARARRLPPSNLRWLNAAFVVVGLCFALLAMNRISCSYLYSVMKGFITLRGVGAYVSMDLFFARPFLCVYLLGYALVYWILLRTRREHWSLFILGAVVLLYWWLNLRQLYEFRRSLLVVNCFGVGSFATFFLNRRVKVSNAVILTALTAVVWLLFKGYDAELATPHAYFVLLLCWTLAIFVPAWMLMRRSPLFDSAGHFLFLWALAFLLFSNQGYPLSDNYRYLLAYGIALPHYIVPECSLMLALLLVATIAARRFPRAAIVGFDLGAAALLGGAILDLGLAHTLGARADWNLVTMSNDLVVIARTVAPYALQAAAVIAALTGLYLTLSWLASRERLQKLIGRFPLAFYFTPRTSHALLGLQWLFVAVAVAFFIERDKAEGYCVTHVVATSPLMRHGNAARLSPNEFAALAGKLNLCVDAPPLLKGGKVDAKRPNVVLILLESTYNRYLSLFGAADETQPRMKKYLNRMELFPNFYSVFPNSFHARFCVLSGLYPTHEYASYLNPRISAPSLPEILHRYGYRNSLFQSDSRDYVRFADYIGHRSMDAHYDCANMPGREKFKTVSWGVEEAATLNAMKRQFAGYAARKERFFLSYMPVAPHMPYDTPAEEFRKFPSGYETVTRNYSGRYKNQLLYIDWVLGSMLDELAALKLLDDTLVIITNDHGELVGEQDGKLGHGWLVRPELCNNPLIILNPGRTSAATNYTLGAQVDILPTVLELLQIPLPANNLYQGNSMYDPRATNKTVYLTSHQQRGLIHGNRYVVEDRTVSGQQDNAPTLVYEISHTQTKSNYRLLNVSTNITRTMDDFERFQTSFIVHYSTYLDAMHQPQFRMAMHR